MLHFLQSFKSFGIRDLNLGSILKFGATLLLLLFSVQTINAQFSVTTSPPLVNNNGAGGITFELESASPVIITGIDNDWYSGTLSNVEVWYRIGGVEHSAGNAPDVTTANGWVQLWTGTVNGNSGTQVPIPNFNNLTIQPNQRVGIAMFGASTNYQTWTSSSQDVFTDNVLTIFTGQNAGYGGGGSWPNHPRQFLGTVHYSLAGPCTDPPFIGTAVASKNQVCSGEPFNLSVDTATFGLGQSYQWQSSPDGNSWTDMPNDTMPGINGQTQTSTNYYRMYLTCGTSTDTSGAVMVETNVTPLSGTVTINSGLPTGSGNYNSFDDLVNILNCSGVDGPLTVNVTSGSGPYEEQITIGYIGGSSSTNTITINGNGEVLEFDNTNSSDRAILRFDGAKHITIDNLTIRSINSTRGWGIHFINAADSNVVKNCLIDISSVTSTTLSNSGGIVFSASLTSVTSAGDNGSYNLIENNEITGDASGGPYTGIMVYGNTTLDGSVHNIIRNNTVHDFHLHGIRASNAAHTIIENNDVARPTRTSTGVVRGIYLTLSSDGIIIRNNEIHDLNTGSSNTSAAYFISNNAGASQSDPTWVYNNLMYEANGGGTQYGIYNAAAWANYYHNSIALDDPDPVSEDTYGFYTTTASNDNLEVKNNIFFMGRNTSSSSNYAIRVNTASVQDFESDNNVFHLAHGAGVGYRTNGYATLSDWTTATGDDANSIVVNPFFVDAANGDLAPANGNIKGIGANLSAVVDEDIFGTPRPTAPDPGAIEFTPLPCLPPSNISGFTQNRQIFNDWQVDTDVDSVRIEWGPQGFQPGTGDEVYTSDTSFVITQYNGNNLATNTCYDVYFWSYCGGNTGPLREGPYTYCTSCGIFAAPFFEDFDGSSWVPGTGTTNRGEIDDCWERDPAGSSGSAWAWYVHTGSTTSSNTGPDEDKSGSGNYLYNESYGSVSDLAFVMTPQIDLGTITRPALSFWYHMHGDDIQYIKTEIQRNQSGIWEEVDIIEGEQQTSSSDPWEERVVLLKDFMGDTIQIRWSNEKGTTFTNDAALDEVSVFEGPTCFPPSGLDLDSLSSSTASISWLSYDTIFDVEWGTPGFTPGSGLGIDSVQGVNTPYTISGLNPATVYHIYVRDPCDPNNWLGPIEIQTECLSALSGTYTVGGTVGPNNFSTLDSAITTLIGCGVSGPVVFEIEGSHTYSILFEDMPIGVSSTNTITFRGANAGAADSIIALSGQPAVFQLSGAHDLFIENLVLQNTGGNFVVHMMDGCHDISIDSCIIIGDVTATAAATGCIVASGSLTSSTSTGDNVTRLSVTNSHLIGNYNGINVYGPGTAAGNRNRSVIIENNTFTEQHYYGARVRNMDSIVMIGNHVSEMRNTTTHALHIAYSDEFYIHENFASASTYSFYMFQVGDENAPRRSEVVNNMFVESNSSIYGSTVRGVDIYHNSTNANNYGLHLLGTLDSLDIRNNIFASYGSNLAFYSTVTSPGQITMDYNLYYTDGTDIARFGAVADTYSDLSDWQTNQSQYNANSLEGDPIYTAPDDLQILGLLPNDAGDNSVGVSIDYFGNPRPAPGATQVDIGAHEYTPAADDIAMLDLVGPNQNECGDSSTTIEVVVRNQGTNPQSGFTVGADITSPIVANVSMTYSGTLNPLDTDTITIGSFNSRDGGLFEFTAYVDLTGDQNTDNDTVMASIDIGKVTAPDIFADSDTICENGNALVWVENANDIYWINSVGDTLAFGDSLSVLNLSSTETFIARTVPPQSFTVGEPDSTIGSTTNFTNLNAQSAEIDVKEPLTIDSVKIYPNSGGLLDIELKDMSNNVLQTVTVNVPAPSIPNGPVRIHVGMQISVPGQYRLGGNATNNAGGLIRNGDGAVYPYTSPALDITGNTFAVDYYYYWYDIKYTVGSCEQDDAVKTITTVPGMPPTADFTFGLNPAPNTTVDFDASGSQDADIYYWNFGDGSGDTTTAANISHTYATGGDYTVTLIVENNVCGERDTLVLQVQGVNVDEDELSLTAKVYPNPTEDAFTLTFDLSAPQNVEVRISSVDGRLVFEKDYGRHHGTFTQSYDLDGYAKGVYLIEVFTDKDKITRRVMLQ